VGNPSGDLMRQSIRATMTLAPKFYCSLNWQSLVLAQKQIHGQFYVVQSVYTDRLKKRLEIPIVVFH
jgi:hypothetical protein